MGMLGVEEPIETKEVDPLLHSQLLFPLKDADEDAVFIC